MTWLTAYYRGEKLLACKLGFQKKNPNKQKPTKKKTQKNPPQKKKTTTNAP